MSSILVSEDEVEDFSFLFESRGVDQTFFLKVWEALCFLERKLSSFF